jgi:hypothetical protein
MATTSYLARTKRHFAFQIAPEREHFGEVGLMVGFDYRRGVVDTTVLSRWYRESSVWTPIMVVADFLE